MTKVGLRLMGIIALISGIVVLCTGMPHGIFAIGAGLYIMFKPMDSVE